MASDEAAHRQDVEELTQALRTRSDLADLREELEEKGVDWRTARLAWLVENEAGEEHGAIATAAGRVYRFVRDQGSTGAWRFTSFLDATDDPRLWEDCRREIEVALAMVREREPPEVR